MTGEARMVQWMSAGHQGLCALVSPDVLVPICRRVVVRADERLVPDSLLRAWVSVHGGAQ